MASSRSRKWLWWLMGVIGLVVVAVIAGPFVYIHFIEDDPPPRLTLTQPSGSSIAGITRVALAGTWQVGSGSTAGYRVKEVLFGQDNEATGRTSTITGSVTIDGMTVKTADITVDLTTVKSDEDRRDRQFQGRIMDTAQFPNATFKLTQPIVLGAEPADGTPITVKGTGDLTLHGVTKSVTIDLKAERNGDTIQVSSTIPVVFADYQIPNPSFGGITTEDHGEFEFLVKLSRT